MKTLEKVSDMWPYDGEDGILRPGRRAPETGRYLAMGGDGRPIKTFATQAGYKLPTVRGHSGVTLRLLRDDETDPCEAPPCRTCGSPPEEVHDREWALSCRCYGTGFHARREGALAAWTSRQRRARGAKG